MSGRSDRPTALSVFPARRRFGAPCSGDGSIPGAFCGRAGGCLPLGRDLFVNCIQTLRPVFPGRDGAFGGSLPGGSVRLSGSAGRGLSGLCGLGHAGTAVQPDGRDEGVPAGGAVQLSWQPAAGPRAHQPGHAAGAGVPALLFQHGRHKRCVADHLCAVCLHRTYHGASSGGCWCRWSCCRRWPPTWAAS